MSLLRKSRASCEECGGTPRKLRKDSQAQLAATVEGRRHLKAAVAEMASSSESVTPSHIARKLAAGEASLRMDGSALRHQVQRILKNQLGGQRRQARQKAEAVTWSQEWEQCIAQNSDPSGKICFQSTPSGTGCFVATFPPFFAGLQDLQKANLLADLVISCDCTWEVEKTKAGRQMAYCLVYAAVDRKLGKENHALYRAVFSCLQGQLQAFDLPAPRQCHSDWMRGLPRVVKEFWPDCLPCQGVEHMLRALRRKTQRTESGKVVRVRQVFAFCPTLSGPLTNPSPVPGVLAPFYQSGHTCLGATEMGCVCHQGVCLQRQ